MTIDANSFLLPATGERPAGGRFRTGTCHASHGQGPAPAPAAPRFGAEFWSQLTLWQRFAGMGGVVMLAAMAIMGSWVSDRIEAGVVRNTAVATALYMDSVIAPISQELNSTDSLSPEAARALDDLLVNTLLGERVVSFKIWKQGGRIAHASSRELVGQTFEPTAALRAAWTGQVMAAFDELHDDEDAPERETGLPLLEIYSPIRAIGSGEIIAVAEFYEVAQGLEQDLLEARLKSWVMVGAVMLSMAGLLFGIVLSGSRTIGRQRLELEAQVADLGQLAAQNDGLRLRVQRASSRAAELNERFLRRISAELHDGPAQLMGFASLRLGSLAGPRREGSEPSEAGVVRAALDDAMQQIRDICRGLALPDLDGLPLAQVARQAVGRHRDLSRTDVAVRIAVPEALQLSHSENICIYRFIQEGLVNAFRHAGGKSQQVALRLDGDGLEVTVSDRGPGFAPAAARPLGNGGLGLAGLRERVEALGGKFSAGNDPRGGVRLTLTLALDGGD